VADKPEARVRGEAGDGMAFLLLTKLGFPCPRIRLAATLPDVDQRSTTDSKTLSLASLGARDHQEDLEHSRKLDTRIVARPQDVAVVVKDRVIQKQRRDRCDECDRHKPSSPRRSPLLARCRKRRASGALAPMLNSIGHDEKPPSVLLELRPRR
jgi:hypothetical protein